MAVSLFLGFLCVVVVIGFVLLSFFLSFDFDGESSY